MPDAASGCKQMGLNKKTNVGVFFFVARRRDSWGPDVSSAHHPFYNASVSGMCDGHGRQNNIS